MPGNLQKRITKDFQTLYEMKHLCAICGEIFRPLISPAICDGLASDWNLTNEQRRFFDFREGCSCSSCGSTVRVMNLGKSLLEVLNIRDNKGWQFVKDIEFSEISNCRIAEINNCGVLHTYLKQFAGLYYSEYGSVDPNLPSEDLMNLSSDDGVFDIILTSDVIEHVPDYGKALLEIKRVLRDDGVFIFTVPFLLDRKTVARTGLNERGAVVHYMSPSFHGVYDAGKEDYIVFYEFGYDFIEELVEIFDTRIYSHDGFGGLVSSVFVCRKKFKPVK